MIDRKGRFHVQGLPAVSIFPDDRIPGAYYAIPDCPRLAVEGSRPQINLILHGTQERSQFHLTGGLFSCTTSLHLLDQERKLLDEGLKERAGIEGSDPVRWLHPLWLKGQSNLSLGRVAQLTAIPSLFGSNDCAFQTSLSEPAAREVEEAWQDGTLRIYARYTLTGQAVSEEFVVEGNLETHSYELSLLITRVILP